MPPPSLRYKGKLIWYPGIIFGRPPPEIDWSSGQGLGIPWRSADDLPSEAATSGLVWTTTDKLLEDLQDTDHLVGVISVLELYLTVLTEPVDLLLAALRALTRLCWGYQDRVLCAVKCRVCEHLAKVLHWHWRTDIRDVILAILHVLIMLADHGGRSVRSHLGSLGFPGLLAATLKWNRLYNINSGDIVEFACKAIYQLSIGCSENRVLLRRAGVDKELYCISRYPFFLPRLQQQQVRDQAIQILTLMKDQLISDLADTEDCWFVVSSLRVSVADMRHYDPQHPNDGKGEDLVQTGLHALLRILQTNNQNSRDELNWNATTQFTILGTCELLVEILSNFGHFSSCTTTACKAISAMLQDISFSAYPVKRDPGGLSFQETVSQQTIIEISPTSHDTDDDTEASSIIRLKTNKNRSLSWDDSGKGATAWQKRVAQTNLSLPVVDVISGQFSSSGAEEEDVEVEMLQAIVEEQRMMLSPEFFNQMDMVDINSKLSSFSFKSSIFEISPMKNIDNDFLNGVRIVNKNSTDTSNDTCSVLTNPTKDMTGVMEVSYVDSPEIDLNVIQVDVGRRQKRFQSVGVCEALVEILKINYQDSMLMSGEILYHSAAVQQNGNEEREPEGSFFKSAVSSFNSIFSKSDPGAIFNTSDAATGAGHGCNRQTIPRSPAMQLASPRYRKSSNTGQGTKKSFQFRNVANEMLNSICDAIRKLVNENILARLDFSRIGLYSVLFKIRQDTELPEGDLDCVGSLQTWLNRHLIENLTHGFDSAEETALCIHHALHMCIGESKTLQCFVLLESVANDSLVTESTVLVAALRAVGQVVSRPDKNEILSIIFNKSNGASCGCLKLIIDAPAEYSADLEVISQWCNTVATLASSSSELREILGGYGSCSSASTLLDLHKTRPSIVQDILWCLCSLSANNQKNLAEILAWRGRDSTKVSMNSLLLALYKSRSQTNETREHAELLLGWLDIAVTSPQDLDNGAEENRTYSHIKTRSNSFSYGSLNTNNRSVLQSEDGVYPLVSNVEPQKIVWFSGEPGTLCFDGEIHGFHGNAADEAYWGSIEV